MILVISAKNIMSAKAKFCFPTKDPAENLVDDIRSDSEKVTDILRIWSQILTHEEKLIWNDIVKYYFT